MGALQMLMRSAASVPKPSAGKKALFFDSANGGLPSTKDENNVVSSLVGVIASRLVATSGYLQGGGDLSADRSLSLTPAAAGVIASGLNNALTVANILDFGGDPTGQTSSDTALNNAIASLPNGGTVLFPAGTFRLTFAPFTVSAANICLSGQGPNATVIKTNAAAGDQLLMTGYGCSVRHLSVQGPGTGTTSQKTSGTGLRMESTEGTVEDCNFAYQYDALSLSGFLVDADKLMIRYFARSGIVVNHNSDHRIANVTMDNNASTLPTGAGIDVQTTASLLIDDCNIIHSNFALNVSPASGVTIPSIKANNSFFDTSVVGLNMTGAGSVFRSEFTNCWFSSMTVAGIRIQPASGGTVDGITFVNCDIYNNVGGTTNGLQLGGSAGSVGKLKFSACSIAGWTVGVNIAAAGTSFFPQFLGNTIGAVSAFGANGTGVVVAAGTYKGLVMQGNDVVDNGTAASFGAVTLATNTAAGAQLLRILDNPGINPRGAVTPPASAPVSATTYFNSTGFRVLVNFKSAATAPTVFTINGVASVLPLASQIVPVILEPGGTISYTATAAATWTWIGL